MDRVVLSNDVVAFEWRYSFYGLLLLQYIINVYSTHAGVTN